MFLRSILLCFGVFTLSFPVLADDVRIAFNGDMYLFNEGMESYPWFAIVKKQEGDGYYAAEKAQIDMQYKSNDGDGWWEVNGTPSAFFYVSGLPLREHEPLTTDMPTAHHAPTDTIALPVGELYVLSKDLGIQLAVSGAYEWDEENHYPALKHYEIRVDTGKHSQILFETDFMDGASPSLVWFGDLNGDISPDILLDVSTKYGSKNYMLFLSRYEQSKVVYEKAASIESGGGC